MKEIKQGGFMLGDTLNKISRLMYILGEFDKGEVFLADIAEELMVNVRTIQRDIKILESAGFPIANPSKGEYAFVEGYSLQKLQLSAKEAAMLALLSSIAGTLGGSFQETYVSLRDRILQNDKENPFYIKLPKGQAFLDDSHSKLIEKAIKKQEKLTIVYDKSKLSGRDISPLKIAWFDGFWYLLALGKDDVILKLRLDKIKELKPTGVSFKRPKKIEKILEESASVWFEDKRDKRVQLLIDPEAAPYFEKKEYFPKQKVVKKSAKDGLVLECFTGKYEEILPTILAWLPHIMVQEPTELSKQIETILASYQSKKKKI